MEHSNKKRVCIIGAGPRGLVTARHLSTVADLEVVNFEAKEDVGGLWLYKEVNTVDPKFDGLKKVDNYYHLYNCFHSSMYESLITNLPYFFMDYKDLSMLDVERELPLFISVEQYRRYLAAYADHFELRKHIQFNTVVKSVRLYENLSVEEKQKIRNPRRFLVKTVDSMGTLDTNEKYHDFDYIVVTSGQYSLPFIPKLPGIEKFKGHVLPCKEFRTPNADIFKNKKILVLGGGASALDMLIQFFSDEVEREQDCEKVVICSRKVSHISTSEDFKPFIGQGRLIVHEGKVEGFKGSNIVCFSDGSEEEIDTMIYATGYKLKFPYFDYEKDKIIDNDEEENRGAFFGPTYRKFIAIREPHVFFIGYLEMTSIIHILPELQAIAAKYIIEEKLSVPSQEEMMKVFEEEVADHLKYVGDLAHFYKTNLSNSYPLPNNYEQNEWMLFSNWLKPVHPNNNEAKAKEFYDAILETKKKISSFKKKGNFLQYKNYDYYEFFPKGFRNTSDFV